MLICEICVYLWLRLQRARDFSIRLFIHRFMVNRRPNLIPLLRSVRMGCFAGSMPTWLPNY